MVSVSARVSLLYTSPRSATGTPVTGELPTLPALSVADSYVNVARSLLQWRFDAGQGRAGQGGKGEWVGGGGAARGCAQVQGGKHNEVRVRAAAVLS